jgi:hypothetical protein
LKGHLDGQPIGVEAGFGVEGPELGQGGEGQTPNVLSEQWV